MQWDYQWRNTIQNSPAAEVKSAVEGLLQRSNVSLLKAEATRCTEQLAKRCDVTQEKPENQTRSQSPLDDIAVTGLLQVAQ